MHRFDLSSAQFFFFIALAFICLECYLILVGSPFFPFAVCRDLGSAATFWYTFRAQTRSNINTKEPNRQSFVRIWRQHQQICDNFIFWAVYDMPRKSERWFHFRPIDKYTIVSFVCDMNKYEEKNNAVIKAKSYASLLPECEIRNVGAHGNTVKFYRRQNVYRMDKCMERLTIDFRKLKITPFWYPFYSHWYLTHVNSP